MKPSVWLHIERLTKARKKHWPERSKQELVQLADQLYNRQDITRAEVSKLCSILETSPTWPGTWVIPDAPLPVGHSVLRAYLDNTPAWLLEGFNSILEVQSGSSVLDLGCGNGQLATYVPPTAFYEGYDKQQEKITEAQQVFPQHIFEKCDLTSWVSQEPQAVYNLCFLHLEAKQVIVQSPCLETQSGPVINLEKALVELAVKSVGHGCFVAIVGDCSLSPSLMTWLSSKGLVTCELVTPELTLTIFRKGIKKGSMLRSQFVDSATFLSWCLSPDSPRYKVPICPEDPRPMALKSWDITLEVPSSLGKLDSSLNQSQLILAKNKLDVRWKQLEEPLSWASSHCISQSEASWTKQMFLFNRECLEVNAYLIRRTSYSSPDIFSSIVSVTESLSLFKYLNKLALKLERVSKPYPERSNLENRYLTLGSGDKLLQESLLVPGTWREWSVKFSETDHVNSSYPRLHLEPLS